ncbi:MAG TPA: hypothetical protein VK841_20850 [Polyangiaceae bacterium]|nr:hypothetical protein [Polyangiaceae bacterium]
MDETDFFDVWLTRAEAARYVGAAGESTIRAAETKGLASTTDEAGQVWHRPDVLDEWSWRNKSPPYAQKARVLREAARARHREARTRERQREAEVRVNGHQELTHHGHDELTHASVPEWVAFTSWARASPPSVRFV